MSHTSGLPVMRTYTTLLRHVEWEDAGVDECIGLRGHAYGTTPVPYMNPCGSVCVLYQSSTQFVASYLRMCVCVNVVVVVVSAIINYARFCFIYLS